MKKVILFSILTFSLVAQSQEKIKMKTVLFSQNNLKSASQIAAPVNTLYTFSTFTEAYQPFTGILLTGGLKWDDPSFSIQLGFNFKLYNAQGSTINFAEASFATFDNPSASILTMASPMFEDICDRAFKSTSSEGDPGGVSGISYTVTGTAGTKICKIQVENAGFFEELALNDTSVSFVNFQVWFYETSGDIEFRFGAVDIQNPSINLNNPSGFICGLAEKVDLNTANNQSSNLLSGPHANPSMVALTTSVNEVITGSIQSGRVYRFSRVNLNPVGISFNKPAQEISFFPNPASNTLYSNNDDNGLFKDATVYFYSLDGRLVSCKKAAQEMEISDMIKGIYMIRVQSTGGEYLYSGKLVVID